MNLVNDVVAIGVFFGAQATGDNHLAVFIESLTNRIKRFLHCCINEATGIDDDQISTIVRLGCFVAFCTQLGQNLLGINQGFGAAKRNKTDFGSHGRSGGRRIGHDRNG